MTHPRLSLIRRLLAFRQHLDVEIRRRVHKLSLHAEHWGFVAIAAVDAFHWHSYLFLVSLWLFVTGLLAELMHVGD